MNTTGYLDPELLPFTAEEFFRGLALATDDAEKAREVSDLFAETLAGGASEGTVEEIKRMELDTAWGEERTGITDWAPLPRY